MEGEGGKVAPPTSKSFPRAWSGLGKLLIKLRKTGMFKRKHARGRPRTVPVRNKRRDRAKASVLTKGGNFEHECDASCHTNRSDLDSLKTFVKFHSCATQ